MEQRFIKGDNLSFKEYLLVWNNPVCFHSLGKWFFFCTLKTIIYCVPFVLIMLLFALIAGSLPKDITKIVKFFSFIVLWLLGMVWCVSFCNAFIIPLVLRRRIPGFVNRYIPEAMDVSLYRTRRTLHVIIGRTALREKFPDIIRFQRHPLMETIWTGKQRLKSCLFWRVSQSFIRMSTFLLA